MPDSTTLIPYLFQAGLKENLRWLTKVMVSNNGYEQKQRLRNAPRQSFDFSISMPRGEIAKLDTLLFGNRGAEFYMPVSSEGRTLDVATSASSPNIDVNSEFADFRVGSQALIWNSPRDFEIVTILSIATNQIVADANISKVHPVTALVMPLRIAFLKTNPKRKLTGDNQSFSGNFLIKENIKLATAASATVYKTFDVYLDQPLAVKSSAVDVYSTRVDVLDYGTGAREQFSPHLKTKTKRSFGVQLDSQEDVWNFRLWLHRRAGKAVSFWMPTWESNFTLLSTGALTTQFLATNDGQDTLSSGRNDLAILTDSGWLLRGIISIVPSGNDLLVTVDSTLAIDASEVELISFLGRKRLTSDDQKVQWDGNNTAHATVGITEINDFVAHPRVLVEVPPNSPCPNSCVESADIMLVIDNTGSQKISEYDTVTLPAINTMVQRWIDTAKDVRVGVVLIEEVPVLGNALTTNLASIVALITAIPEPSGSTNLADAITVAAAELDDFARGGVEPVMIIITDGLPNYPVSSTAVGDAEVAAKAARDSGIRIVTFGVMGQNLLDQPGGGGG